MPSFAHPLTAHITVLKRRMLVIGLTMIGAFALTFAYSGELIQWFKRPFSDDLIFYSPTEALFASIKVSFLAAGAEGTSAGSAAGGVLLPAGALHKQEGREVVWVVRDGKVERRAIRWNKHAEGEVLVLAGLTPGEKVVIDGPATLADGTRVKEKNP